MSWWQFAARHHVIPLVEIDDLDVPRMAIAPMETDSPLVIDSDAVLSGAIATEFFKPVSRRDA
jgi:hypothetical protein